MKFFFETYIFGIILHEEFKEGKRPSGDNSVISFQRQIDDGKSKTMHPNK